MGYKEFKEPSSNLDCGNSGTSARLIAGLLAAQDFTSTLIGDESLSKRPMKRVVDPLMKMGPEFQSNEKLTLPVTIIPKSNINSIDYEMPVASAQVKSSILIAGLHCDEVTTVIEKEQTRDHTEKMLGLPVKVTEGKIISSSSKKYYPEAKEYFVPGDISTSAFHIILTLLTPNSELYHAQVKVKPVNLFYHTDDGRYSVEPVDDIFKLRRKRKQFTKDEILTEIENSPEKFSPNVLLRPICQDYIFPTGFYIAGPSEISYFAQITPLYDFYNIITPIVYPRSSATLLEKNVGAALDKYDLTMHDIFLGLDELKEKVISGLSENNIEKAFEEASNEIELTFDRLKENLFAVDKTLVDASLRYREKIVSSIAELKSKATKAQETKHETTIRQLTRLSNLLYPLGNLQEREINFTYFYNKYGKDFIRKVYDDISVNEFEHQIISL